MSKGPSESQERNETRIIKFRDLEPGKEYITAKDTMLYTGAGSAPTACVRLPKGTSFGIAIKAVSSLQLHFKDDMSVHFVLGELNTDEIEVVD